MQPDYADCQGAPAYQALVEHGKKLLGGFDIFSFARGVSTFGFAGSIAFKLPILALSKNLILFKFFYRGSIKPKLF